MKNRRTALIAVLVAALALAAVLPALAADKAPETAAFAVPNLNDEAVVKNLTDGLAKVKGVVAAKADAATGKFLVTFKPEKTNPEKLTAAIVKIAPEAKFEGVTAADGKAADHSACGKCPNKSSCGGAKK